MSAYRKCPFHLNIAETEEKLINNLGNELKRCADRALENGKTFRIGLSGGSLVQLLTRALITHKLDTKCWQFFFCDERYVPHDHEESTYRAYKTEMLSQLLNIADCQFVKANISLPLDDCAKDYEARMKCAFKSNCPDFDLLLLGMGPDGHTCSLFPEQPESLKEAKSLVIPIRNSPKPPPERITFTLPLINNAKDVVFVVTGASKAEVLKRVFVKLDKEFPAAWIEPTHGALTLLADAAAGSSLNCC